MNVTKDQAQDYLQTIQQVQQQTRRTLALSGGPLYMIIWGLVWFLGYMGNHFLSPEPAGYLWMSLSVTGFVVSAGVGLWSSTKVRSSTNDYRIAIFWIAWVIYTSLIVFLGSDYMDPTQVSIVVSLMAMFGYVVMGLWMWTPMVWIGAGVTVLITLAALFATQYVDIIMAFLGGGSLVLIGIYVYRKWR